MIESVTTLGKTNKQINKQKRKKERKCAFIESEVVIFLSFRKIKN